MNPYLFLFDKNLSKHNIDYNLLNTRINIFLLDNVSYHELYLSQYMKFCIWDIDCNLNNFVIEDAGRLIFLDGYIQKKYINDLKLIKDPDIFFKYSPGGIYTCFYVDKINDSVKIYQSITGANNPVFLTENNGLYSISNYAIISYLGANYNGDISIDQNYFFDILESLYSIHGNTPFSGTKKIDCGKQINIELNSFKLISRDPKLDIYLRPNLDDYLELADSILKDSLDIYPDIDEKVLFLSGGKDSRLLCSLFSAAGNNIEVYNLNGPYHMEGCIANDVAQRCGYELSHHYLSPNDDIIDSTKKRIVTQGGMLRDYLKIKFR